ncbi:MAG: Trk system potassium transporter TrkA [Clostridia bacterium]|nr:Trk system potassium transporter TrkA [Clostridia bacterium]
MKILIAGCGQVGQTLAQELSAEGHDLTLMDSDPQVLEMGMERYDVIAIQGNCASMQTLHAANVEMADLLIACTGSDELNLLCCMTAHAINPHLHTIARIRNHEYVEQTYRMRDTFALSMIFNPEQQAAQEIERLLRFPGFLKRDSFAKGRVEIVELRVDADSRLCNVPLSALNAIVKCKVLVCTVLREGQAITPDGRFVLHAGDRIFVTAPSENLALLLKNLGIVQHKIRNVMVVGGGTLCYYLANLLQNSSIGMTVIEADRARCVELASAFPRVEVICGDAREQSLLESEGISSADALIALTGLDELNLLISLYGQSCRIPQTVTRLENLTETGITRDLTLGSVICPRRLCCNSIVRYVRAMQNQEGAAVAVHSIADGQAEALEFVVDEHTLHCGEPLRKLKLKKNVLLAAITSGGKTEIPSGDSTFAIGDSVVVVETSDDVILQLNDIFA